MFKKLGGPGTFRHRLAKGRGMSAALYIDVVKVSVIHATPHSRVDQAGGQLRGSH